MTAPVARHSPPHKYAGHDTRDAQQPPDIARGSFNQGNPYSEGTMIRPALACSIAIISASPLSAQAASLVGVWKVTYPAGARVENGQQSTIFGTGKLRIEARGDSLIGEFSPEPVPDLPEPKPIRIAGLTGTMPVALVSRQMTTVEVNDTRKLIGFTSTWKLEARGDSLSGTLSHRVEDPDVNAQDPGPVTGIRQRR